MRRKQQLPIEITGHIHNESQNTLGSGQARFQSV
jgi:hypothetical protein